MLEGAGMARVPAMPTGVFALNNFVRKWPHRHARGGLEAPLLIMSLFCEEQERWVVLA